MTASIETDLFANRVRLKELRVEHRDLDSILEELNKHPYADAMIANSETFKTMTGMDISWDIFPEDVYFDKVTAALSSGSTEYDAFMTGAYMTWTYGPAGWITDLNEYIKDPAKTNPNYAWDDVLPGLRASTSTARRSWRIRSLKLQIADFRLQIYCRFLHCRLRTTNLKSAISNFRFRLSTACPDLSGWRAADRRRRPQPAARATGPVPRKPIALCRTGSRRARPASHPC